MPFAVVGRGGTTAPLASARLSLARSRLGGRPCNGDAMAALERATWEPACGVMISRVAMGCSVVLGGAERVRQLVGS